MQKFPWDIVSNNDTIINFNPVQKNLNFDQPKNITNEPPNLIEAMYKNDLNIIKIHEAICAVFGYKYGSISELKKEKEKLNYEILNDKSLNIIELKDKQNRINTIDYDISDIKNGISWKEYVKKAKPLLESYLPISSNESRGIINISIFKQKEEDNEILTKRHKIINEYLELARNYIKLNIQTEIPNISICSICNKNISDIEDEDERGVLICDCGIERISMPQSFFQNNKFDSTSKSLYDDLSTFLKRLNTFECKQDYEIPESLFITLDEYFISIGKPSSEKIRSLSLLPNGKKLGTSIKLLETGLYETQNSEYYKDMEYITHKLWGWKIHNLDNYREQIITDYKKTQEIYKNIKREESMSGTKKRNSNLNINMRLYWHLKAVNYPYIEYDDFKTVTSRDSLEYHNKTMKRMCLETGIKFYDVI